MMNDENRLGDDETTTLAADFSSGPSNNNAITSTPALSPEQQQQHQQQQRRDGTTSSNSRGEEPSGFARSLSRNTMEGIDDDDDVDGQQQQQQQQLAELERVIEQIPLAEKAAYLQALEQCPHLVEIESNPHTFLRVDDGNVWKAAQRLVSYWQMRLEMFGAERAFRPLNDLSGNGALDEEAIAAVGAGSQVFLPHDKSGLPVFFLDIAMCDPSLSLESTARAGHFLISLIWRNHPIVQEEGYNTVILHNEAFFAWSLHPVAVHLALAMKTWPIRMKAVYMLNKTDPEQKADNDDGSLLHSQLRAARHSELQGNDEMMGKLNPIIASSNEEMVRKLQMCGMSASGLPTSIGGTWEFSNFYEWFDTVRNRDPPTNAADNWLRTPYESNSHSSFSTSSRLSASHEHERSNDKTLLEEFSHQEQQTNVPTIETATNVVAETTMDTSNVVSLEKRQRVTTMLEAMEYSDDLEKEAYTYAMKHVPWLVESESSPSRFIECETSTSNDCDPWTAARRLVRYWSLRKRIFGDRAFRPLHQTEVAEVEGAGNAPRSDACLTEADVEWLRCGYHTILPMMDQQGRSVLWIDESKRLYQKDGTRSESDGISSPMAILRSLFYALQVISENEQSQRQGWVCLVLDSGNPSHPALPISAAVVEFGRDLLAALPIKSVDLHVVFPSWLSECDQGDSPDVMTDSVLIFQPRRPTIHMAHTQQDALSVMESIGVHAEGLPSEVGGILTEHDRSQWHLGRVQEELKREIQYATSFTNQKQFASQSSTVTDDSAEAWQEQNVMTRFQHVLDRIPQSNKAAYLLAKENVPDLIQHESPTMRFLKHSEYDASAAAHRLVAYWESRYALFGERAFLPMNLTGKGALSEFEINQVVASGFVVGCCKDSKGRSIIYMNKKRIIETSKPSGDPSPGLEARLRSRVFFYWMHVAAENPLSQTDGLVLFILWGPPFRLQANYKFEMGLLAKAMPLHLASHHVLCLNQHMDSVFPRLIHSLKSTIVEKTFVHAFKTNEDFLAHFNRLGFTSELVPEEFGGGWSYDKEFESLLVERKRLESAYQREFLNVHPNVEHLLAACNKQNRESATVDEESETARFEKGEMIDRCLVALENFVNLLPDSSKAAYMEAMDKIPRLVAKESDSIRFLKACRYDPMVAAKRLTAYWTSRKEIFKDRAFLPLNLSDQGAVTAKGDIALLNSGYCCLLPDDRNGRPVFCIDKSRIENKQLIRCMPRVSFYLASVVSENESAQENGCVVVVVLSKMPQEKDPIFDLTETALPLRVAQVHFVVTPTTKISVTNTLEQWAREHFGARATIHSGKSTDELASKLESCGFEKEKLPSSVGGTWSYAEFNHWLDRRARIEWEVPLVATDSKNTSNNLTGRIKTTSELDREERAERARRRDVLHSRRKRAKKKSALEDLKRQVADLQSSKQSASEENLRLEGLVNDAEVMVTEHLNEDGQPELALQPDIDAPPVRDQQVSGDIEMSGDLQELSNTQERSSSWNNPNPMNALDPIDGLSTSGSLDGTANRNSPPLLFNQSVQQGGGDTWPTNLSLQANNQSLQQSAILPLQQADLLQAQHQAALQQQMQQTTTRVPPSMGPTSLQHLQQQQQQQQQSNISSAGFASHQLQRNQQQVADALHGTSQEQQYLLGQHQHHQHHHSALSGLLFGPQVSDVPSNLQRPTPGGVHNLLLHQQPHAAQIQMGIVSQGLGLTTTAPFYGGNGSSIAGLLEGTMLQSATAASSLAAAQQQQQQQQQQQHASDDAQRDLLVQLLLAHQATSSSSSPPGSHSLEEGSSSNDGASGGM